MKNEKVLCYGPIDPSTEFIPSVDLFFRVDKFEDKFSYLDRSVCENDPSYKQVIPYVIIYDLTRDYWLSYQRKQGDERLIGNMSIGIGGHINPCDHDTRLNLTIRKNVVRELGEELGSFRVPKDPTDYVCRGFIYDPTNNVGEVHVGIVYTTNWYLTPEQYTFQDNEHEFKPRAYKEIAANFDRLENWSKIYFERCILKKKNQNFYPIGDVDGIH